MPSTSKSNQEKPKVNDQQQQRNWLELPNDVTTNILYRIGAFDLLENAQKVCTNWRRICKDPAMWSIIYMDNFSYPSSGPQRDYWNRRLQEMCKNAVDRSQGQLLDLTIVGFANNELLRYVADRSSELRRLEISHCQEETYGSWIEALMRFPLLEELVLFMTEIPKEAIEIAGRYCPMLKALKLNDNPCRTRERYCDGDEFLTVCDEIAIAIGQNLLELRHLELIGDDMSNTGLEVILDGCRHLELLDLRHCMYIDLEGDLGKKCSENIKCLKLPKASLEGCPYRRFFEDYDVVVITWVY